MAAIFLADITGPAGTDAANAKFTALETDMASALRSRGALPTTQALFGMTGTNWNGLWTVASANTNPDLPATPGTAAELKVENTANDLYMRIAFRSGGGVYEIYGSAGNWLTWHRIDYALAYQGAPAADVALATLNKRSDIGIHRILENRNHPDLPELPPGWGTASLTSLPDGVSSTLQFLAVNYQSNSGNNLFWRNQTGPSGLFTDWAQMGASGGGGGSVPDSEAILADLALVKSQLTPETTFENNRIFTTYTEGERYMDWLAMQNPDKVTILDLGESTSGLPIRAFQLGDPTKPTYYVMAAQHGSEPMVRETSYLWVRDLCQDTSTELATFLTNACIVVAPVINADRINVSRLSSTGTDLNGNWTTESTAEITAASSVFDTHNVVLTLDAHEGGKWLTMQAETPTAPEVHQALKDVSNALFAAVETDFSTAGEAFERFPGASTLTQARNIIPDRYKSSTILFEGTSSLDANMYEPDVVLRRDVYMIVYRSVFAYVLTHMPDFVAAKTAAGG